MSTPGASRGGAIATRGLLAQTLIALLDITRSSPPFTEITLEPMAGDDQFDFLWKNADGSHATQVKSTENLFAKAEVELWAKKLENARTDETCTLVLVGNIAPGLVKVDAVGKVALKQKPLDLDGLIAEAAQRLAEFMESESLDAGTAKDRIKIVHAIESRLQHLSTDATTLTREAFVTLFREWIATAPKERIRVDLSHFDVVKYAPAKLLGREAETKLLEDAWAKKRPHILTFVALGGEGKTSLVAKWAAELASQGWPGVRRRVRVVVLQPGDAGAAGGFVRPVPQGGPLTFFGDAAMAGSAAGAFDKGRRLARLVGERRALLILDGLEPLQYAPISPTPGELKDQGIAALLKGLAGNSDGLCAVTTRYSIPDLRAYVGKTVEEKKLERLSTEAGVELLQSFRVRGLLNELEKLVEDVKGHALTLNLLGSYLRDAHAGDIRKRDRIKLEEADAEEQGGHAFRVMDAYVASLANVGKTSDDQAKGRRALALLRLLGLFDRPATADTLAALWGGEAIAGLTDPLIGISEAQRNLALHRLEDARLLTVSRAPGSGVLVAVDAHPLVREYFGKRLRDAQPEAWRAAHRRLYEHLRATTPDKPNATLEDLQPLYQAVAHGCQAGLQQETSDKVYYGRITRGEEFYSTNKLGAIGSRPGSRGLLLRDSVEPRLARAHGSRPGLDVGRSRLQPARLGPADRGPRADAGGARYGC